MAVLWVLIFPSDMSSGRTDLALSAAPYLPNQVTSDKKSKAGEADEQKVRRNTWHVFMKGLGCIDPITPASISIPM